MQPPPRRIASDCDSGIEGGDLSQPKSLGSIGLLALWRETRRMHEYAPMNDYCQVFSDSMFSTLSDSLNVFKQGYFQGFQTGVRGKDMRPGWPIQCVENRVIETWRQVGKGSSLQLGKGSSHVAGQRQSTVCACLNDYM